MTNTPPSPAPQEYQMVRLTAAAHAKLKELAEAKKRSMSNQAEVLIESAHAEMTHPEMAEVGTVLIIGNPEHANAELLQALTRERKVIVKQFSELPTPANRPSAMIVGG